MKLPTINFLTCLAALSLSISGLGQGAAPGKPASPAPTATPGGIAQPPLSGQDPKKNRITQALNGNTSLAVAGSVYRAAPSDAIPPLVIQFSSTNETIIQDWEEDLSVMTQLIEQSLQRAAEEDLADFKISRVLISGNRSVRPLYLESFGALFMIKVNFPVVA